MGGLGGLQLGVSLEELYAGALASYHPSSCETAFPSYHPSSQA